jgi:hypothetical protein
MGRERSFDFKKLIASKKHHPFIIRPPVRQNFTHTPNDPRLYFLFIEIYLPADPAHLIKLPKTY